MPLSQAPTYNLKVVLQETGVAADTLRAWERRYGVPKPQRTPGGHRLYSQRDIHLIKWLVARQAEGMSISRAVQHWNELAGSGEDPLAEVRLQGGLGLAASLPHLDSVRAEWLAACFAFDEGQAERVLNQAFAVYSAEVVITEVVLRGLHEVGDRWQRGQVTVQQEHFVSGLAARRFDALIAAAPAPNQSGTVVLACPPTEMHSLPLLYLNVMLRRRGRHVVYLGADVPLEHLEETARSVKTALVVMSAQRLPAARSLRDAAALLAQKRVPLAYGGRVFNQVPDLRGHIAGELLGEDVQACLDRIEELMARPAPPRKPETLSVNAPAQAYWALRPEIEAALQRKLGAQAEGAVDLTIANSYFGGALGAALEFGNVGYLSADMEWLRFLLSKPRLPFTTPHTFFREYAAALREVMGKTGSEIADQLERLAEHA